MDPLTTKQKRTAFIMNRIMGLDQKAAQTMLLRLLFVGVSAKKFEDAFNDLKL